MFKRFFFAFLLLASTLTVQVPPAHAQNIQTLDRILPEIRRSVPGSFGGEADGPVAGPDGQARYRIKWVTPDGRILWIEADARTGRILNQTSGGTERQPDPPRGGRSNFRESEGGGLNDRPLIRFPSLIRPGTGN